MVGRRLQRWSNIGSVLYSLGTISFESVAEHIGVMLALSWDTIYGEPTINPTLIPYFEFTRHHILQMSSRTCRHQAEI